MRTFFTTALLILFAWPGHRAENPFYDAIRNNDLAALQQLVKKPGVGAQDQRGDHALDARGGADYRCHVDGSPEIARLMIEM